MIQTKHAEVILLGALTPYFGDRLPENLGSQTYSAIRRHLGKEGYSDDSHAEEVFARTLVSSMEFLARRGGDTVRDPRSWFLAIGRNSTIKYLKELTPLIELQAGLDGEICLTEAGQFTEDQVQQTVLRALENLSPRHRELIRLDLGECLSPGEIQRRMGIKSRGYFKKLKSSAFAALRNALRTIIDDTLAL